MAFTSGVPNAGSDDNHGIQLQVHGQVQNLLLFDRPGDDALENKGDLWRFQISSFNFADSCITIGEIEGVAIIERSSDGWNIESIVTVVRDSLGGVGVLTHDFHVNRWVDDQDSRRHFPLTIISVPATPATPTPPATRESAATPTPPATRESAATPTPPVTRGSAATPAPPATRGSAATPAPPATRGSAATPAPPATQGSAVTQIPTSQCIPSASGIFRPSPATMNGGVSVLLESTPAAQCFIKHLLHTTQQFLLK